MYSSVCGVLKMPGFKGDVVSSANSSTPEAVNPSITYALLNAISIGSPSALQITDSLTDPISWAEEEIFVMPDWQLTVNLTGVIAVPIREARFTDAVKSSRLKTTRVVYVSGINRR